MGSLAARVQWRITKAILVAEEIASNESQRKTDLDEALSWALQQVSRSGKDVHFPLEFMEFVRGCIRKMSCQAQVIKADPAGGDDIPSRRFSLLINTMSDIPPLDLLMAQDLALLADLYQTNLTPMLAGVSWIGDVASHFRWSSSLGGKGRILATIVRSMQSETCLELGTAYGMSAAFILEMLQAMGREGHLTTIEGEASIFSLSSKILTDRYGQRVTCYCGRTQDTLCAIVETLKDVDFVFHDTWDIRAMIT
ncbi:MAG: class I SAM-dependent methyltransferase [Anaerolineae bacterium]